MKQAAGSFLYPARDLAWTALGHFEYWLRPSLRDSWGGPFNGQAARQLMFMELWSLLRFPVIVETGAYRGSTTLFLFYHSDARIFSVEADPRYFAYSRIRLRKCDRVRLTLGDCRPFLRDVAAEVDLAAPTLFYLDAHWKNDLPLRDELGLIVSAWRNPVVIVDDFRVPADAAYRFDDYGIGKVLDLPYLEPLQEFGMSAWYPSYPAVSDTGARRGCVVLARPNGLPSGLRWLTPADPAARS